MRLTVVAAVLALILASSPFLAPAKLDYSAAIPVFNR